MEDLSRYVTKFKESEVYSHSFILNENELKDSLQVCIEILDAISYFKKMKQHKVDSINGFQGTFPELRAKYIDNIDTYNRCIERLYKRYNHQLNKLSNA